jgi:hypothetical protein
MSTPGTGEPRRVLAAERQIPEFDVFLVGDRWQAVHRADHDLTLEHSDWQELFMACVGVRIRREIQKATDELMERHLAARGFGGETVPVEGPCGGLNA